MNQEMLDKLGKIISGSILRLRMRSPFFATLGIHTRYFPSREVQTVSTNGHYEIYYNPDFLLQLPARQMDAALLHSVMHAALGHYDMPPTCSITLWNYAADIIVNGVVAKQEYLEFLPGAIRDKDVEDKPVAEVYEILMKKSVTLGKFTGGCFACQGKQLEAPPMMSPQERSERRAYWNQATQKALTVQRTTAPGASGLPAWLEQLAAQLEELNDDWRAALWRFLVKTPADFDGFDRRIINRGFYIEDTRIDNVNVILGVDTSSGVDAEQRATFIDECVKILAAYPHLQPTIVFQNKEALYGPFDPRDKIPQPYTTVRASARSFWEFVEQESSSRQEASICIYLTDGFGELPTQPPNLPVLWLVLPGGRRLDKFPFGRGVRFLRFS